MASSTGTLLGMALKCLAFLALFVTPEVTPVATSGASTDTPTSGDRFSLVGKDGVLGLYDSSATWPQTGLLECAVYCRWDAQCPGFLWNSSDGACTIGRCTAASQGSLSLQPQPPQAGTGPTRLYAASRQGKCPCYLGYEVRTEDTTRQCLYVSPRAATYPVADLTCTSHGGRLVKANTRPLLDLVMGMAVDRAADPHSGPSTSIWIGLDDVAEEGSFRWSDGAALTPGETTLLFETGEPNNWYKGEKNVGDCVRISRRTSKLLDSDCNAQLIFSCEIVLD